jgi:hypothetical protein
VLLLGNKLDEPRQVSEETIADFVEKQGCLEAKISCKLNINVKVTWSRISELLVDEFATRLKPESVRL